jgi:serine/threonine protein kinase
MDDIKKQVSNKKKEGDADFKRGKISFAAEAYRSALRMINSTPESKKQLKAWTAVISGMLSTCYVKQGSWQEAIQFANDAIELSKGKNVKALAAKATACENVGDLQTALEAGTKAFELDSSLHEVQLITHRCSILLNGVINGPKPRSSDFEQISILGEGNYSDVFKVKSTWTNQIFALKVLSLDKVKKKEKRHKNIKNEIMMEREVLLTLNHPNIVKLYHTFGDAAALYYLFDYTENMEELWSLMLNSKTKQFQIGLEESYARYLFAQIINGIEYLHREGIVHRDLKPENIMVKLNGHLVLIDFGTCKNLVNTKFNGPEFVGTAEYMSPEAIDNIGTDTNSDLWSVGCILYQMLVGPVPFKGGSEYYTFLRVQNGVPFDIYKETVSKEGLDLIMSLLKRDPKKRLGYNEQPPSPCTQESYRSTIKYDMIKDHPFFSTSYNGHTPINFKVMESSDFLSSNKPPLRTLTELYLEGVCDSAMKGLRPKLYKLNNKIRNKAKQYFRIRRKLSDPDVVRLFYKNRMEATFLKVEDRGVLGFSQAEGSKYVKPFYFVQVSHPSIGVSLDSPQALRLKNIVNAVNSIKPRPAFFVCIGDLTEHGCECEDDGDDTTANSDRYIQEVNNYKRILCDLAPTITVISIGSAKNYGKAPLTIEKLNQYRNHFGQDYFRFWKSGICFIVINGVLLESVKDDFINVNDSKAEENEIESAEAMLKRWKYFDQNYRDKTLWGKHVQWIRQSLFLSRTNSKQAVLLSNHILKSNENKNSAADPQLPSYYSEHLIEKMKWSYCKTAISPHRTRNSRVIDKTSSEGYEANDITCLTTMASDGFRIVRMFDDTIRTAYHTPGAGMIKTLSLNAEDNVETVVVNEDVDSSSFKFKNQNEYEAHLDALGNSIDKNATLESLNIAPSNLDVGNSNAQNESDDSEDDDGELIVEDVTKEQTY